MNLKSIVKGVGATATTIGAVVSLLIALEGYAPKDYIDPAGIPTACVGHTGPDVHVGHTRSQTECEALLRDDVKVAWDAVGRLAKVPLKPYQQIAFTSFTFNSGVTAFANSTMLKLLNQGKYVEACNELPKWVYGGRPPRIIVGLVNRRDVERKICLGQKVPQVDLNGLTE